MKLKYYLRGLGIGMIVTALLMGYSNNTHAAVATSEETSEVGETTTESSESSILADRNGTVQTEEASETVASTTEPIIIRDEEPETEQSTVPTSVEESEAATELVTETETTTETESASEEESSTEPVPVETPQEVADILASAASAEASETDEVISHGDSITLEIVRGDDSGTVSRKLQTAGLISDATEFDAYLMQHGYDKKISVGTVEIPVGSTWVEIAELLAGK